MAWRSCSIKIVQCTVHCQYSSGQCMLQLLHQPHLHRQPTSPPLRQKLSHSSRTSSGLVGPRELLTNPCSTVNMGVKLDLKKIALHARNAEYNPKRFAAVIMRIRWVDNFQSHTWNKCSGSRGQRPSSSALARWSALAPSLRRTVGEYIFKSRININSWITLTFGHVVISNVS